MTEINMEKASEAIRIGATWWGDRLRGVAKTDNGDPSAMGDRVQGLAGMLQAQEPIRSDDEINRFVDELCKAMTEHRNCQGNGCDGCEDGVYLNSVGVYVDVDYDPDIILSKALERAGVKISPVTLPWKTRMSIRQADDSDDWVVSVSEGYGASTVTLSEPVAVE